MCVYATIADSVIPAILHRNTYMNMFARFDENPGMTLQDIKKTKRYRRTDGRTDAHTDAHTHTHAHMHGQRENSIPTTNKVCGGFKKSNCSIKSYVGVELPIKALSMHIQKSYKVIIV